MLLRCALRHGLCVAGLILAAATALAQGPAEVREYQKKAEFINSFTRFVDWPARKFAQPDSPFVIGVYGTDNISSLLQESIQDRQIKGRPAIIKHLLNKEELRACHVLFISRSERDRLGPILGEVRRENVLTVGECDGFLGKGGIINFVTVGGQVRFQISTDAAAREKFTVSSKLLQLAIPLSQNISVVAPNAIKLSDGQR
ncbi:MAG: YfiR family protein [Chthoniobacter sp.]|uniref:YfiR family protein n=1 Tax=Chthoniobacter sp. TaxID=2510640 RepID=UPI0032A304FA